MVDLLVRTIESDGALLGRRAPCIRALLCETRNPPRRVCTCLHCSASLAEVLIGHLDDSVLDAIVDAFFPKVPDAGSRYLIFTSQSFLLSCYESGRLPLDGRVMDSAGCPRWGESDHARRRRRLFLYCRNGAVRHFRNAWKPASHRQGPPMPATLSEIP